MRLGIVGLGKIARDQHVPAITANPAFQLVATADPVGELPGVVAYEALGGMIAAGGIDAVAICTPPSIRAALTHEAIDAGLHVLLEKPPAISMVEGQALGDHADARGITLFAAWHSREAGSVDAARALLAGRTIQSVEINWKEDIRRWHPGQEWILDANGFGVFDPAINAFSILTAIVPGPIRVERAELAVPENRKAPIAATLALRLANGAETMANLDFLQTGPQTWSILIHTDRGVLELADGGARLIVDGEERQLEPNHEYPRLYARFADLIAGGESDMDLSPLALVLDAVRVGAQVAVPPFHF